MSVTVRLFVSAKVVLDETVTKVSGGVVEGTIADRDLPFESASDTLTDESEEPLRAPLYRERCIGHRIGRRRSDGK